MWKFILLSFFVLTTSFSGWCQNTNDSFESFRKKAQESFNSHKKKATEQFDSFRDECNRKYAESLIEAWGDYFGEAPIKEKEEKPIPPTPFKEEEKRTPLTVTPQPLPQPKPSPRPNPVEPIDEVPVDKGNYAKFNFYGVEGKVRIPMTISLNLRDIKPKSLAQGWEILSGNTMNNTIKDCLSARDKYNLCDWAYLQFLENVGKKIGKNENEITLITAFLYAQSGYQMRLAADGNRLNMLFGSDHDIYNRAFYKINGKKFYPYHSTSNRISICDAVYEGEKPLSLFIRQEQLLGDAMSATREISSKKYADIKIQSKVPVELIKFYNDYPTSGIGNNTITRWAMYANTPLAQKTKEEIYPVLREKLENLSETEAVGKLLNLIQTGLVYEYDDKVWGEDRAFFAEETLYYPYSDCEDRAILFSRLVRDLVGLDVALVYYPGHLATAVKFREAIDGDAMIIEGSRYLVCDPTYIGAPIGRQMPGLNSGNAKAIVLER